MYLIFDDILLGVILPYLNKKDKFSLQFINKHFYNLVKIFNKIIKETYFDIYHYFIETISNNMKNNEYMLNECNFINQLKYKKYQENETGIFYYSKGVYYREYQSIFHPIPYLSLHSHNLYIIMIVYKDIKRSFVIKKYFEYDIKYSIDNIYVDENDMVIKLY